MNQLGLYTLSGLVFSLAVVSFVSWPDKKLEYLKSDTFPTKEITTTSTPEVVTKVETKPVTLHVPLPKQVKAIYMTSCVAGTKDFRERLVKLVEETEINSIILDIKDYSGTISFSPENEAWKGAWQNARCGAQDMREFIEYLHNKDIFVIGRITVFQDPFFANVRPDLAVKRSDGVTVWKDRKGLSFMDVAAKEYWDHIVALSVDSYNLGFDELNFDYVRYPSDGNMADIAFVHSAKTEWPNDKQANLEAFFAYLTKTLRTATLYEKREHKNTGREEAVPWLSADLFGMTTTNFDDLSIGQIQERTVPYFDFVAPMVYPSHYPKNYLGLADPNSNPYLVVNHAMKSGVNRLVSTSTTIKGFTHKLFRSATGTTPAIYEKATSSPSKLRTWIQDFDYGGNYDIKEVREQIQASYDAGVYSWMIWAPSNIYTRGALLGPDIYEVP